MLQCFVIHLECAEMLIHSSLMLFSALFATGLLAGTVDAIAGGGGLVSMPVLFAIGLPPHLALGTNKLQSVCGTAVATYSYYKKGWLEPKKLILGLILGFVGAIAGALTAQAVSADILKKIIPLLLILILIYTLFSPKLGHEEKTPKITETLFYFVFGAVLGFYDGFFGPGVGAFWTFLLIFFLGKSLVRATAYTKAFNANTNIASLLCFAVGSNIDYRIAICMAVGQVLGGRLGAQLAIHNGAKLIRPIFLLVVFATVGTLVYRNYSNVLELHFRAIDASVLILMVALGFYLFRTKEESRE